MKKDNNRREYYKLYHQSKMNDPSYAGKSYREKRREMAREYADSHRERRKEMAKDSNYVESRRKYLKVWRAKNKEQIRDYNRNKRDKTYQGTFVARYSALKQQARMRGSVMPITFNEYKNLLESPCYLCGDSVISVSKSGHGLDRIDSSVGYILSNCRPCCGVCNRMKRDLPIDKFIARIKKILQNYSKADKK